MEMEMMTEAQDIDTEELTPPSSQTDGGRDMMDDQQDKIVDLTQKLWKMEQKLKETQQKLEKEVARNKLPDANEVADLRKRLAAFEEAADGSAGPEKAGPESLFGWYARFDTEKGREEAAADIAKHEADGWQIAHEEYKESIKVYIVRFTRGKRNNPHGTPLTGRRDRSQMNWDGISAAQSAYEWAEGKRREKPPMVIQGRLVGGDAS